MRRMWSTYVLGLKGKKVNKRARSAVRSDCSIFQCGELSYEREGSRTNKFRCNLYNEKKSIVSYTVYESKRATSYTITASHLGIQPSLPKHFQKTTPSKLP